jgi:hypothetical protein
MSSAKKSFEEVKERFPASDEQSEIRSRVIESDLLKERVMKAKRQLPVQIRPIFGHVWPEFKDVKKSIRLRHVLELKVADSEITAKLEELVKILSQTNK